MQRPFGLRPLRSITSDYVASTVDLIVDSSDQTDLFINDPITTLMQTNDTGITFCTKSLPGDSLRGIVVGFKPISERTYENEIYRKSGTYRIVKVIEDPFVYLQARVNDVLLTTDVDRYIDIDDGTGDTITGVSYISLDYDTISDTDGQFKIMSIIEIVNTADEQYTIVECMIAKHELIRGGVIGHGYWDRLLGDLIPKTSGDNINLQEAGRGKGFLDPITDYDVVNLRFLVAYINSLLNLNPKTDVLTVSTPGQTSFTLSQSPFSEDAIILTVRGQTYHRNNGGTIGFTVSGTTLTWSEPEGLILQPGDLVVAWYNFIGTTPPPPVIGYWDRLGTALFPRFSGDHIDMLNAGQAKNFLDPTDSQDLVTLSYLNSAIPSINNKRVIEDVVVSYYLHDTNADVGKIFTNYGATASVQFVSASPGATDVGKWWEYYTTSNYQVSVATFGALRYQDQNILGLVTNEPGASLEIVVMSDLHWHVVKVHGNWSYIYNV